MSPWRSPYGRGQPMDKPKNQRVVAGLVLIVVGLGLFFVQRWGGIGQSAIFLVIGAAFLAAYLYNRVYGFLIPACILLGLGVGSVIGEGTAFDFGDPERLGLGGGFIAIYVIALVYERRSHWWPLIPGAALILTARPDFQDFLREFWPLILVAVGVLILLGGFGRRRRGADTGGSS